MDKRAKVRGGKRRKWEDNEVLCDSMIILYDNAHVYDGKGSCHRDSQYGNEAVVSVMSTR